MENRNRFFDVLVGLFLIVAAYLKTFQAGSEGIVGTTLGFSFMAVLVFAEFCLGTWLVFQPRRESLKKWIVFLVFCSFGIYQFGLMRSGSSRKKGEKKGSQLID